MTMTAIINDPWLAEEIIADRRASGNDRYDEVWEGVYSMAPMANDEHQDLVAGITSVLRFAVQTAGIGLVRPGVNVSDQEEDWTFNFRCPDVVVYLNDTQAENRDTHWYGGPDFAVEIISPHDRAREKFDFYAKVNTRELLYVDRAPWALELYRLQNDQLVPAGKSTLEDPAVLASEVVPLSWKLIAGEKRPQIEIVHNDGEQRWVI